MGRAFRIVDFRARRPQESAMSTAVLREGAASPYRRHTPTLLQVLGSRVWTALEAVGRARARRHLNQIAERWAPLKPELAARLRAAAQFQTQEETR
jgi:hypothetical protein